MIQTKTRPTELPKSSVPNPDKSMFIYVSSQWNIYDTKKEL